MIKPQGEERPTIDILFGLSKRLKGGIEKSFVHIGDDSEGFVKFRTSTLSPWKEFLIKGVWTGADYVYKKYYQLFHTPSHKFEFYSGNLKSLFANIGKGRWKDLDYLPHYRAVKFLGEEERYPLIFLSYKPLMVIENGSQNYPWVQKIFLPMHGIGWGNFLEINRETVHGLKLSDGDEVRIESTFGKITGRVKCSDGVHPQLVAIASGQGHFAYGRWQRGIGLNPYEIIGADFDWISGQAAFFNTRVRIYKA